MKTSMKALLILLAAFLLASAIVEARHRPSPSTRDKAVNETLDMVLLVGSDFRERGKHPTWGEIDAEVARRLRVTRTSLSGVSR